MRKIAEGAGVSLGTLQYYFDDKDALLEACLDGYYERLAALGMRLVADAVSDPGAPIDRVVKDAMRALYRFLEEERTLLELRMTTNALRGELHPSRQDEFLGGIIAEAARALAPRVGREELELRLAIQTLTYGAVHMALMSPSERRRLVGDAAADGVVEDHVVELAARVICGP